ncbi:hypothetical protein M404DRAFT_452367 [Pisolithus tinctorius Marx 270]|uniref:Uncharacterized protein n=1 Tax=Pisolithus tinctorius Marx 270 TaxID=870435 RepID=A0A0C3KWQ3_PISTI|nr:hypothetical protein M404DRAFT_452367 [Pisolithus tinctorius Marx 270]
MQEENADCTALMQCTADALNEKSLQRLLISTQQSSIMLCVEYAVQKTLRRAMELGFRCRLQLGVKSLEDCLLCWFPKCESGPLAPNSGQLRSWSSLENPIPALDNSTPAHITQVRCFTPISGPFRPPGLALLHPGPPRSMSGSPGHNSGLFLFVCTIFSLARSSDFCLLYKSCV